MAAVDSQVLERVINRVNKCSNQKRAPYINKVAASDAAVALSCLGLDKVRFLSFPRGIPIKTTLKGLLSALKRAADLRESEVRCFGCEVCRLGQGLGSP